MGCVLVDPVLVEEELVPIKDKSSLRDSVILDPELSEASTKDSL